MEEELPPELRSRRQAIYAQVTRRGRARRYRRFGVITVALVVVTAMPIVAVALTSNSDGHGQRVSTFGPSTTQGVATTSHTTTTPSSAAPSTVPRTATATTVLATTTSTALVCRNSTNPACGAFSYDPPITNQPATLVATARPASPTAGHVVTFTLHATDPDSFISPDMFCGQISFGEGNSTGCQVSCAPIGPRYGKWDPPPPRPGTATFTMTHTYPHAGTYTAEFSFTADQCGPRPSPASTAVTVHIST
jgi:hypothetical protein